MKLLIILALVLSGCGILEPDESCQTIVQDVLWGHVAEKIQMGLVVEYMEKGCKCPSETLYNGFGKSFGARYTCTCCD